MRAPVATPKSCNVTPSDTKSCMPKRTAPSRAQHPRKPRAKKTAKNPMVHARVTPDELARLEAEVSRQQAAAPAGRITRTSVLRLILRSLPPAE